MSITNTEPAANTSPERRKCRAPLGLSGNEDVQFLLALVPADADPDWAEVLGTYLSPNHAAALVTICGSAERVTRCFDDLRDLDFSLACRMQIEPTFFGPPSQGVFLCHRLDGNVTNLLPLGGVPTEDELLRIAKRCARRFGLVMDLFGHDDRLVPVARTLGCYVCMGGDCLRCAGLER